MAVLYEEYTDLYCDSDPFSLHPCGWSRLIEGARSLRSTLGQCPIEGYDSDSADVDSSRVEIVNDLASEYILVYGETDRLANIRIVLLAYRQYSALAGFHRRCCAVN